MRRKHLINEFLLLLEPDHLLQSSIGARFILVITFDRRHRINVLIRKVNLVFETAAVEFVVNLINVRGTEAGLLAKRIFQFLVAVEVHIGLLLERLEIIERLVSIARSLLQFYERDVLLQTADQFRRKPGGFRHLKENALGISLVLANRLGDEINDRLIRACIIPRLRVRALQLDQDRTALGVPDEILKIIFAVAIRRDLIHPCETLSKHTLVDIQRIHQKLRHLQRRAVTSRRDLVMYRYAVELLAIIVARINTFELIQKSLIRHKFLHMLNRLIVIHSLDGANRLGDVERAVPAIVDFQLVDHSECVDDLFVIPARDQLLKIRGSDLAQLADFDIVHRVLIFKGGFQVFLELNGGGLLQLVHSAHHPEIPGNCMVNEKLQRLIDPIKAEHVVEHLDNLFELLLGLANFRCLFVIVSHLEIVKQHETVPSNFSTKKS